MQTTGIKITMFILVLVLVACKNQIEPTPTSTETVSAEESAEEESISEELSLEQESVPETAVSRAPSYPTLAERPCDLFIPAGDVADKTILCGYVVVPAERGNPMSKEVKLATIILKATGDNPAPDPIIHVSGGPGIAATSRIAIVELAKRYAPMRESRDIILYDQRGVGHSIPLLDCFEFIEGDLNFDATMGEQTLACQEGMAQQGYPAESFTTAVSAADLVDVMHALAYPSYNLYGISYGTRLLMSLLHYFPDEPLIRSVILDSVDTLPEDVGTEYRTATYLLQQDLFESVFEQCDADPDCVGAYPDLRTRFEALTTQLGETPLTLDAYTTIDDDSIYRHLFPYNAAIQNIPYQPRMIAELEQGITTTLELIRLGNIPASPMRTAAMPNEPAVSSSDLLDLFLDCDDGASDDESANRTRLMGLWDAGAQEIANYLRDVCDAETATAAIQITDNNPHIFNYMLMRYVPDDIQGLTPGVNSKLNCTEQFPFREDFADIETNLRDAQMPNFYIEQTINDLYSKADGCEAWQDALTTPTLELYGDYPVLMLHGQFDSLTPPAWAETAVSAIPQAQYIPIPNAWHSIMGNNGDCPTDITVQFLTNPETAVDAACTEEMAVQFVLPITSP